MRELSIGDVARSGMRLRFRLHAHGPLASDSLTVAAAAAVAIARSARVLRGAS